MGVELGKEFGQKIESLNLTDLEGELERQDQTDSAFTDDDLGLKPVVAEATPRIA